MTERKLASASRCKSGLARRPDAPLSRSLRPARPQRRDVEGVGRRGRWVASSARTRRTSVEVHDYVDVGVPVLAYTQSSSGVRDRRASGFSTFVEA